MISPATAAPTLPNPSLPSPRLPLELINLVIDYCDKPFSWVGELSNEQFKTLAILCRVSKYFQQRVQPLLYKRVVFEYPFNLNNIMPEDTKLLDTLRTNTTLQDAVKAVDVFLVFELILAQRKRKQYVKTIRARWLAALRALPNLQIIRLRNGEDTGDRAMLAMWKCVPPTARILDLTDFRLTPKEILDGYRMEEPRGQSNPLLVVVVDQHLAALQQLFLARGIQHVDFITTLDARSPYM
ncbi:hypothetical protein JCM10049v2_006159 [Rhodotorula toruloides]